MEKKDENEKEKESTLLCQVQEQLKKFQKNVMMGQNRYMVILWGILLVVILGQSIYIVRMKHELNQVNEALHRVNDLVHEDSVYLRGMLGSEIANRVCENMEQASSELESYSMDYTDVNPSENTATVKLTVQLRSYDNQASYQIQIHNLQSDMTTFQEMEGEGLQRTCLLTVPSNADYQLDVLKQGQNTGARLTQDFIPLPLKSDLAERTKVESGSCVKTSDHAVRRFVISNCTYGHKSAKIAKVEAILSYNNESVATILLQEVPLEENTTTLPSDSGSASQSVSGFASATATDEIRDIDRGEEARKFELSSSISELKQLIKTPVSDDVTFADFAIRLSVTYEDGSTKRLDEVLNY